MHQLQEIIKGEIRKNGVLSFARFMELSLYCPVYGYYEREKDTIGRRGDYFTSVSVGSLFGEMLAFQFAEWFGDANSGLQIVEAGAHDGRLARDILLWLRQMRTKVFAQVEYWLVEPSQFRRRVQKETLVGLEEKIHWLADISELEKNVQQSDSRPIIIFANELLDAMPVHRLGWDAAKKVWFEWGVMLEGEKLVWARMPMEKECQLSGAGCQVLRLPETLLEHLPDGFTTEISSAAENWWWQAANGLRAGKLMTIDYGLEEEEFFTPERSGGTLRAYYRHRISSDLLAEPGEQDITAHVNFTALRRAGEAAGLRTESFLRQEKFLSKIAGQIWKTPEKFCEWDSAKTRQFQTLTHPEHLGQSFRALIQSGSAHFGIAPKGDLMDAPRVNS